MNTLVKFEVSKLLFDKGFDEFCSNAIGLDYQDIINIPIEYGVRETEYVKYGVLCNSRMDEFNSGYISCPNISDVVMWLYEKYEIWIAVDMDDDKTFYYIASFDHHVSEGSNYNSPTKAYLSAIEYTLKNLIP